MKNEVLQFYLLEIDMQTSFLEDQKRKDSNLNRIFWSRLMQFPKFYEADEDGLSSLNQDWLTKDGMPYKGKPHREVEVNTITIDTLADTYGNPDLIKIDVEGAEWQVMKGMTRHYGGLLCFEWTFETMHQHEDQLDYLFTLGYREMAAQYIVNHLQEPQEWGNMQSNNTNQLNAWHQLTSDAWIDGGWKVANLRPTADVGMLWVR